MKKLVSLFLALGRICTRSRFWLYLGRAEKRAGGACGDACV